MYNNLFDDFDYDSGMLDCSGWDADQECYCYDGFPCPDASDMEEAEMEYRQLKDFDLCRLWKNVKNDYSEGAAMEADFLERTAAKLACESIQVAAMARKFIKSQRARKYENGK